ncbi:MAG: 2-succinyl-5-enolpyruvyl-6-hydroxy-3-cyclohexene-1-carboxylic-acid synthase [Polyangiaceae bacterium]|nr:2-succinyl-5-enolpyruvyl-6-hydroxy-3-cyclohexene-1-carboxylic-acid synthase [Polyangiaceae bacterium]MCW5790370.1 2-succinyl-5-enolpyruvyl-6-hydroxy-3-cyclohexene-1-carboxylic-acid synthase [Polyangiaceae bacterium]
MSLADPRDGARPSSSHILTSWARLLMGRLWRAGVRHFVISPGSRSTPFTWAALELAQKRDPDAPQCHLVLDERSAGFIALGIARRSGAPAALICTSGSAAANYLPAVVEARAAGLPMIVITADRPTALQHVGAPQTMDQQRLYGPAALASFDLGAPSASQGALEALRRTMEQAMALALEGGPVHLNAPADKPLGPEPEGPLAARVDALLEHRSRVTRSAERLLDAAAAQELAQRLRSASSGAIWCGPLTPWQSVSSPVLSQLAELLSFPVWCEATSNVRELPESLRAQRFDVWLRSEAQRAALWPEVVLQLGPLPTSSALANALAQHATERYVLCPFGYQDPPSTARAVHRVDLTPSVQRLIEALRELGSVGDSTALGTPSEREALGTPSKPSPETSDATAASALAAVKRSEAALRVAEAEAATCQAAKIATTTATPSNSEAFAVRNLLNAVPEDCPVTLGNSLIVREADWFHRAPPRGPVWSQRGLSGIDGNLSAILGAALAGDGPTVALVGDLTFLHDVGALWSARDVRSPCVIVVIDNGGGRIFESLPIASEVSPGLLQAWTTPHGVRIADVCRGYQVHHQRVSKTEKPGDVLKQLLKRPRVSVLSVRVAPHSSAEVQAALWERMREHGR